jgi:patatin-like phospholipase/acyl hydrolase
MRILSIDGGGIRGIVPGTVLAALEQRLQQLSGTPLARLADFFDLIAGTSTGGILTALYLCPDSGGRPAYSAADAVGLYLNNGAEIFQTDLFDKLKTLGGLAEEKYSAAPLESLLAQYLGDCRLGDLLKPCLITSYDIERRQAKFFNSQDVKAGGEDFFVKNVCRATSAAPTYFSTAQFNSSAGIPYSFVDGGTFANNPALAAAFEAFGYNDKLTVCDLKVLSVGTGRSDKAYTGAETANWGGIKWLPAILDILMSANSNTTDYGLRALFHSAGCDANYLRIQAELSDYPNVDKAMDNASPVNLRALQACGNDLALKNAAQLDAFAKLLLQ